MADLSKLALWRVSNQQMPPGCEAKCVAYSAQLASATTDTLDLTQWILQGKIDQVQSVYIDNSLNAQTFTLQCSNTNQKVTVAANSQAWMPILSVRDAAMFTFSTTGAVNVPVFFVNVPMPAAVWVV